MTSEGVGIDKLKISSGERIFELGEFSSDLYYIESGKVALGIDSLTIGK